MIGPVSLTVGHGDGDKPRSNAASDDVGAHGGSAEERWAPFYERLNRVLADQVQNLLIGVREFAARITA